MTGVLGVLIVIWCIAGGTSLAAMYLLWRNKQVFRYRIALIDIIRIECARDLEQGRGWTWRWEFFDSVPYNQMLYRFWKPLDSFYPDKSFIHPGVRPMIKE